jgi:cyanophycin synthetase
MKILKTLTLRGPNYWSIRHKRLIVVRLDLAEMSDRPSDTIPGFYAGLVEALPSLESHFCSPGCVGGFLSRVREGTMMGHIMEHVALELQVLAGMEVGFGRTRETADPGVYQVVFQYCHEEAGRYAARAAFRLCESIIETGHYSQAELEKDLADLREIKADSALGPSTGALVQAAGQRSIPFIPLVSRGMIQLGYGKYQRRIQASLTNCSSLLGVELAGDKDSTKQLLGQAGVPVPQGTLIQSLAELTESIESIGGYPIVIKPLNGNHGRGITLDIQSWNEAEKAYDVARKVCKEIIVEKFYPGSDHRILVVNGRVIAVAERLPAHVVGNGKDSIDHLVAVENRNPRRGKGHDNVLTQLPLDEATDEILTRQNCDRNTVLKEGEVCYLRSTANLSTGGIAVDRTDDIHPDTVWMAERVAALIGLDVAGIDLVTPDITKPVGEVGGVVVEVNAAPGLRMHFAPSEGIARNVAAPIIEMLFPAGTPTRIPIVAVTGTNGKTTTTRLIAHIFRQVHDNVGLTTTDGIYINDHLIDKGDNTGPLSAQVILQDPTVDIAVLESARGGILRSGLAFDTCDVGVVLNVAADHLGLGDINTIDEMARVKAVIAEAVDPDGVAILNADDERVAAMSDRVRGQVAYFTMNPENPIVLDHVQRGGIAAVYDKGYLAIWQQDWVHRIAPAKQLPVTMAGKAPFMIANALAASLAAFVKGVEIEAIQTALLSFRASVEQTPGRMNLFNLGKYHALVDYAHNPAGYEAVGGFVKNWVGPTVGVIGGPGDRRDCDLIALGQISAGIFDQIVIKEDFDKRGRELGEVATILTEGVTLGNPKLTPQVILDETEAINQALDNAPEGGLVVIFPESVTRAIDLINARNPLPEVKIDAIEPKPGRKRRQTAATERSNSNNGKKPQPVETAIIS